MTTETELREFVRPAQALYIDGTQAAMQPNELPSYAVDGNTSTVSQASGQYRWIQQVDLQQVESFNVITVDQPTTAYATEYNSAGKVVFDLDHQRHHRTATERGANAQGEAP